MTQTEPAAKPRKKKPLPRGPYALPPEVVAQDQRERLLAALPEAIVAHGYEGTTVSHIVEIAGVARGAFYKQFVDKRDCFAAAHEAAHERLLGVLTFPCYARSGLGERVEGSLGAGLAFLASEPELARLLAVEAPAAGQEIAKRHHEWMNRYGALLRRAALGQPEIVMPPRAIEPVIVGGISSSIAEQVLAGRTKRLPELLPGLTAYVLSCYRSPAPEDPRVGLLRADSSQPEQPPPARAAASA
jgi:AcrR family transcriptional regulator